MIRMFVIVLSLCVAASRQFTPLPTVTQVAPNKCGVLSVLPPGRAHLLQLNGTLDERGYAHGFLLRQQIIDWTVLYLLEAGMNGDLEWYGRFSAWWAASQFVPAAVATEVQGMLRGLKDAASAQGASLYVPELGRDYGETDLHLISAYLEASPGHGALTQGPWVPSGGPACSQFVAWGSLTAHGAPLAGRNMDGETDGGPGWVTVRHLIVFAVTPAEGEKKRVVSVMWPGHVGGLSLMNEDGLYLMLNCGSQGPGGPASNVTAISHVMRSLASSLSAAEATPTGVRGPRSPVGRGRTALSAVSMRRVPPSLPPPLPACRPSCRPRSPARAARVQAMAFMNQYRGSRGGVSAAGSNIVFARPRSPFARAGAALSAEEAPGYVAELDRSGGIVRMAADGDSFVASTNHFVQYGVAAGTNVTTRDPSPDPLSPWLNFGVGVAHAPPAHSYWRLMAVLAALRARAHLGPAGEIGGPLDAGSLLQRPAHGSTEHSIVFAPETRQVALAVAAPWDTQGAWDAPYQPWHVYEFEELFAPPGTYPPGTYGQPSCTSRLVGGDCLGARVPRSVYLTVACGVAVGLLALGVGAVQRRARVRRTDAAACMLSDGANTQSKM